MITKFNFKDRTIKSYAIRKLTPFECFRLMGIRDAVIHIMQSTFAQAKERMTFLLKKNRAIVERFTISNDDLENDVPKKRIMDYIKKQNGKYLGLYKHYSKDANFLIGVKHEGENGFYYEWLSDYQYMLKNEEQPEVYPKNNTNRIDIPLCPLDAIIIGKFYKEYLQEDLDDCKIDATKESPSFVYSIIYNYQLFVKYEVKNTKAFKGKDDDMVISASQQYKQAGNSIVVDVLKHIYSQLWYPVKKAPKIQMDMFDTLFADDMLPDYPADWNADTQTYGNPQQKKHILTTFSGYDSQLMAADALREDHPDFDWDCVGWSDIDKYACQMHDLVFPQYADKALGDITKIDWHKVKADLNGEDVDLFTYSSPCQDISQAGKQMGLKEGSGSRSALLWNVADAIEVLKPKYLLQENVAALVSEKFMPDFQLWLKKLESLGYVNRWALLNAKDYGVPQNRLRVFCLSMRRDVAFEYDFPEGFELTRKLEDILETEVDERYFLKDDAVSKFLKANDKDSAVFVQFPMSPTHENAMFLKTWLTMTMDALKMWELSPTQLEQKVEELKPKFNEVYLTWKDKGEFPGDAFKELFNENMTRKNG